LIDLLKPMSGLSLLAMMVLAWSAWITVRSGFGFSSSAVQPSSNSSRCNDRKRLVSLVRAPRPLVWSGMGGTGEAYAGARTKQELWFGNHG